MLMDTKSKMKKWPKGGEA